MNQFYDILIIVSLKILLIIGFIAAIKVWLKRVNNYIPMTIYWVIGIFFVLILSSHIFEVILLPLSNPKNSLLSDKDSVSTLSFILGLAFYLFTGLKYLRRKKSL